MTAVDAAVVALDRVVVFDIDDTLYLEREYVRSGFRAVGAWARRTLGVPDLGERAWEAFEAGVRGTIFDAALAGAGVEATPELLARMVSCYRDHEPAITLLDDARTALDGLEVDTGHTAVAVITDGPRASQSAKARSLGLATWSQHVILTETLGDGFGKPHPHAFELVQQRLGVDPERCTYIADNPAKDFVAPHRLGWRTIRVRRPRGLHHGVDGGDDIDHEVSDMTDLLGLIGRRGVLR
ncbi:MAG TPA: HAD family hydrolase [Acidimicrobiales bacterium]